MNMKLRKGISGFTSLIIFILAATLAVCLVASLVDPSWLPFAGLLTLLTPVMILINVIMLLYSLFRRKKAGFVTLLVLGLSWPQIANLWAFHFVSPESEDPQIKILTYNVRDFDLYNWSNNKNSRDHIYDMLKEVRPDILCFQEFYTQPDGEWDNISDIRSSLGLQNYYFTRELVLSENRQWGIATFSRYPIIGHGELLKPENPNKRGLFPNRGIYTDIKIGQDTFRVFNLHLASIYLGRDDYTALENISEQKDVALRNLRSIMTKLLNGYRNRGKQVRKFTEFINESDQPHPLIICGDFNDIPTSYTYNMISRGLKDAFLSTNWGPGATYNGLIPGLRIDNILVSPEIEVAASEVIRLKVSDHYPLLTKIKLPGAD